MPETEVVPQQSDPQPQPQGDPAKTAPEGQPQQDPKQVSTQRPGADPKSGDDARQRGILADLQKERQSRQQLEKRLQELEKVGRERARRIREAVIGEKPEEAEQRQIREALHGLSPRLKRIEELSDEQFEGLLKSIGVAETVAETEVRGWERHSHGMFDAVSAKVAERLGGDLSERQRKALVRYYVGEAESDPAFLQRHNAGDAKLIEEVANTFIEDWYEPARRSVTQTEVNRTSRRVPSGKDRGVVTQGRKKIDFKDEKAVEDAMVQSFRDHGGVFEG